MATEAETEATTAIVASEEQGVLTDILTRIPEYARDSIGSLSSGVPVWDAGTILLPIPDLYLPREELLALYSETILKNNFTRDCAHVRCAGCGLMNIRIDDTVCVFTSSAEEGEVPKFARRRYFPHAMEAISTRNNTEYLCSQCRTDGFHPCAHCGSVTKGYRRTRSCEACYTARAAGNRRSRDTFKSFSRVTDAWTADDAPILFGIELEFSEIEGRRTLSTFLGSKDFPFSSRMLEVKEDASLSRGFETTMGEATGAQIKKDIINLCKAYQFFPHTGRGAGLHIHASFTNEDKRKMLYNRVASLHSAIEPLLFAAVPVWRQRNSMCTPTFDTFYAPEEVKNAYVSDRYKSLNMQSIQKFGTLEWRIFPSSSNAEMLIGYQSLVDWMMQTVHAEASLTAEEWGKRNPKLENVRAYLEEAFATPDTPNFRFLNKAFALLSLPNALTDFLVERIGYNLMQRLKVEKEDQTKSMFTKRDASLPAYSYDTARNTKTLRTLKESFQD